MTSDHHAHSGRPGDWVEVRGVHGQLPRRGEILEVLGRAGHEQYRVRWDEQHESILFPADGVIVHPTASRSGATRHATPRG